MSEFQFPPKPKLNASSLMDVAHLFLRTRYCPPPICNLGFEQCYSLTKGHFTCIWAPLILLKSCYPSSQLTALGRKWSSWWQSIKTHYNSMLSSNYYVTDPCEESSAICVIWELSKPLDEMQSDGIIGQILRPECRRRFCGCCWQFLLRCLTKRCSINIYLIIQWLPSPLLYRCGDRASGGHLIYPGSWSL